MDEQFTARPIFSVNNPGEKKHDKVEVKISPMSADKKTIFLEITRRETVRSNEDQVQRQRG